MKELEQLKKPIPYKWKVQTCNEWGASFVAYIDARDVMDVLDSTGLPWQSEFYEVCGKLFCKVALYIDNQWVCKSDTGTESSYEKEKGQASDAFKRAAVHWGIGRFLYKLGIVKHKETVNYKGKWYPAENGRAMSNARIQEICNREG